MFNAIDKLLPPDRGPYSFREISLTLRVEEEAVYRAWESLHRREGTKEIVTPVDGRKPFLLTAQGAQRVARYFFNRWSLEEINRLLAAKDIATLGVKTEQTPGGTDEAPANLSATRTEYP